MTFICHKCGSSRFICSRGSQSLEMQLQYEWASWFLVVSILLHKTSRGQRFEIASENMNLHPRCLNRVPMITVKHHRAQSNYARDLDHWSDGWSISVLSTNPASVITSATDGFLFSVTIGNGIAIILHDESRHSIANQLYYGRAYPMMPNHHWWLRKSLHSYAG